MSDELYNEIYNLRVEIQTIKEVLSQIKSELVNIRAELRRGRDTEQQSSQDKTVSVKRTDDWKTRGWG